MKKVELLAPAGSAAALRAAVNAGADAVYLAGKSFGARAFAENFSDDELAAASKYAHLHDVSVHVTVNTTVNDAEMSELDRYLLELAEVNVDAILVQDLGVAARARELIPHIPLHASTQMTIHNLEGVRAASELGFSRVVLARELSLDEITYIVANADVEIEVFVHGALCVCTSGQCLMSSMIGARSGNRGRCAQPCRLPYELISSDGVTVEAGKYILSPKDLNSLERLAALVETGVDSLKIEGRMKRPEYVAIVVETYRRALDRCLERTSEFAPTAEERRRLAQIFNRDFTTAYLDGRIDRTMISDKKPNNRGLPVGRVIALDGRKVTIKASEEIVVGDQIEIWIKVGGRINFTVERLERRSDLVTLEVESVKGVRVHDRVFKIFDAKLAEHAQKIFEPSANKIPIDARVSARIGQPLTLTFLDADGLTAEARTKSSATAAENRPLTREAIAKQIGRLGTTEFVLGSLTVELDDGLMLPISELNDVRRRAVERLEELRLKKFVKTAGVAENVVSTPKLLYEQSCVEDKQRDVILQSSVDDFDSILEGGVDHFTPSSVEGTDGNNSAWNSTTSAPQGKSMQSDVEDARFSFFHSQPPTIVSLRRRTSKPRLIVAVDSLDQIRSLDGADGVIFGGDSFRHHALKSSDYTQAVELAHSMHLAAYVGTPRIVRNSEQAVLESLLRAVDGADGVYVHNLGTLRLVRHCTNLPVATDFSLIAYNSSTVAELARLGVECVTLSPELTLEQIKSLHSDVALECIVGGRIELMITFYCPIGSFAGCNRVCERKRFLLRDRMNAEFPVVTDQFCRAHILNSRPLSMLEHANELRSLDRLRIDGRAMSTAELRSAIKNFRAALYGQRIVESGKQITRGHFFRGV